MKNNIVILILLLSSSFSFGQEEVNWKDLSQVTYTEKFFVMYDDYFLYPDFGNSIKALEGKQVTVKGYFLNISPEDKLFILSKGPMSSCFFCGKGGPETAIELEFSNTPSFKTDDIVSVTGVLKLNKDDVERFNYILTGCKVKLIK